MTHPTLDFPECMELSEQVRRYVLALMQASAKEGPSVVVIGAEQEDIGSEEKSYSDITADSINVELKEFGDIDRKTLEERVKAERSEVRKHNRKIAKQAQVAKEEAEKRTIDVSQIVKRNPKPTPAMLATLAEQARLAMARAEELAGEPVVYCCGAIRKERINECPGTCGARPEYRVVNQLGQVN